MLPKDISSDAASPARESGATAHANSCIILVTYGNRHHFLAKAVAAILRQSTARIVVIYNGNWDSASATIDPRVENICLEQNLGSAGGFRAGIEAALKLDTNYFLLLDDDNLPEAGCLEKLFSTHAQLGGSPLLALQAFRPAQPWQRLVVRKGMMTLGRPNTYGWFNLFNERHLLWGQLGSRAPTTESEPNAGNAPVQINVAAYGGLFIHRGALELGELPDPRYFCYYDDLDFTDRLVRRGVKIHLCADAMIADLDLSWHARTARAHPAFSRSTPDKRIYLDLRNAFIFYRSRMTNRALYLINGVGFWLGIGYLAIFRSTDIGTTLHRLALILQAVKHGTRGEFTEFDTWQPEPTHSRT